MSRKRLFVRIVISTILLSVAWAGAWSWAAVQALRVQDVERAARSSGMAYPVVVAYDAVSFGALPDIRFWRLSLAGLMHASSVVDASRQARQPGPSATLYSLKPLVPIVTHLNPILVGLDATLPRTLIARRVLPAQYQTYLHLAAQNMPNLQTIVQKWSTGEHRWLILFQNHHELRASGGFMGSYAIVTIEDGEVRSVRVEDIYDADGQFTGYIEAPPGVAEYLSASNGLRLPDANWDPDFSKSAQTILQYFALGDRTGIDLVTAVTLELAEEILAITGPIPLPDYQIAVDAHNLPDVLGSHREQFFPGSIQKKQALGYVLTNVRLQLEQLSPDQWQQVTRVIAHATATKALQFYAIDPDIQVIFDAAHLSGQLGTTDTDLFYLVESNVGINKVNEFVSRTVKLTVEPTSLTAEVTFTNTTPPASQSARTAYINYQRLVTPADWRVSQITIDDQPITLIAQEQRTINGQQLSETGFLVPVPVGAPVRLKISMDKPVNRSRVISVQKQPGLPPTPYMVLTGSGRHDFVLERDTQIQP